MPVSANSLQHDASPKSNPHQQGLPTGPIGVATRAEKRALPDNKDFWARVNAVTFTQRGAGRRAAYRAVAFYCSLKHARSNAAVATLATRADISVSVMRRHLRWFEAHGYIAAAGSRVGGRSKGTEYTLVLPVPVELNPVVTTALNPVVTTAKERKEVSTSLTYVPEAEDVRTSSEPIAAAENTEPSSGPSFPSPKPYEPQTKLYAKLYRKVATPDWLILTDDHLDTFEGHTYQTKKSILDGLIDQEQHQAGHARPQAASSPSDAQSIVNVLGAALNGTRTPTDDSGRLRLQSACEQKGHDWTVDGPFMECHRCGASKLVPSEDRKPDLEGGS